MPCVTYTKQSLNKGIACGWSGLGLRLVCSMSVIKYNQLTLKLQVAQGWGQKKSAPVYRSGFFTDILTDEVNLFSLELLYHF
jgi:hypothetical protein